jgi:hypothetical protein
MVLFVGDDWAEEVMTGLKIITMWRCRTRRAAGWARPGFLRVLPGSPGCMR